MSDANSDDEFDIESPDESRYEDELRGHGYDGIHEYDNPSPRWLTSIFTATIVWSVIYCLGMWLDFMPGWHETHDESMEQLQRKRAKAEQEADTVSASRLQKAAESDEMVDGGEEVYRKNCSRCHGDRGGGEIGPNLTDDYWIHGGSLTDVYATIKNGVSDKGMPAWGPQLSQKEMVGVTAYIRSLRGTDPPDAKKPEGDKWTPDQ